MKSHILLPAFLLSLFFTNSVNAQFTQFGETQQFFNPAVTGKNGQHEAHALVHIDRFPGGNMLDRELLTYSARINKYNSGIGFSYNRYRFSILAQDQLKVNYAYHMELAKEHVLSTGVSFGYFRNDMSQFVGYSYDQNSLIIDTITGGVGHAFSVDAGLNYHYRKLNIGFSIDQLNQPTFNSGDFGNKLYMTYSFYGSYLFGKSSGFQVKPQFLYSQTNAFKELNLMVTGIYKNTYSLSFMTRLRNTMGLVFGYTLNDKYTISYAYGFTVSKLNNGFSRGSHELHVGILLPKK